MIFVQDEPVVGTLTRLAAFRPPKWMLIALAIPPTLFLFDPLLRYRLRIAAEQLELRRPWGTRKNFPWSRLEGVQMDEHVIKHIERGSTRIGVVQLIIRDEDGTRQRLAVEGSWGLVSLMTWFVR